MTEPRSRPQYGEYASPEDQAKAIRVPHTPQDQPNAEPAPIEAAVSAPTGGSWLGPRQQSAVPGPSAMDGRAGTARQLGRPRDIGFTAALLAIGLFWILVSIPGMANLSATIQQTYAMEGYTGHYGPVALASAIGLAINISQLVLWGVTCALSVLAIRKRRRAFYIPLIGGAVSALVVMVLTIVAMLNDPGLLQFLSTLKG
ncbi:MAG: hypothetical protein QOG18_722 [Microbacteriaceae bacterium]|jgi:hypothetical protein|nr:hypothetical protein [Microbacteriaceae bacterium]